MTLLTKYTWYNGNSEIYSNIIKGYKAEIKLNLLSLSKLTTAFKHIIEKTVKILVVPWQ